MLWDGLSHGQTWLPFPPHIPCPFKGMNWKMIETLLLTFHWSERSYMITPHYRREGKMYSLAGLLCAQLISEEERIDIWNN